MPERPKRQTPSRRELPPLRPVVIVPGIMASELREASTGLLVWPPKNTIAGKVEVQPQRLNLLTGYEFLVARDFATDGSTPGQISALAYDELILRLQREGWRFDNKKLYFFEYNWANSNKVAGEKLAKAIEYILGLPENAAFDKVDVVAHSMGGIVTRSAMVFNSARIRRASFIASPHYGTPKAYAALHPGIGLKFADSFLGAVATQLAWLVMKNPGDPFTPAEKINELAKDLPGAYELLPDEFYFSQQNWLFTFHSAGNRAMTSWRKGYLERRTTKFQTARARALSEGAVKFKISLGQTMPAGLEASQIFFSSSESTIDECVMDWSHISGPTGTSTERPGAGDGTVVALSARDSGNPAIQVAGTHSGLPNDAAVLNPLVTFLKS